MDGKFGHLTKTEKNKMMLSHQTLDGLTMTCHSLIELVPYLLRCGMPEVYTESLCNDPVEEFFGSERKQGRRNENPDMVQFGQNAGTIRTQQFISCTSGNTCGRKKKNKKDWVEVNDERLPKRKSN